MNIQAMEAQLERLFEEKKLPGAAVCMLGPEGQMYARGFGHRDAAGEKPVDENTIFGIASMSKSMTALALCMLECEGKLSLEDPVAKYLPQFRVPGIPQEMVTIRHLCMHTAGIPPMEPLEWSIAMNSKERDSEWIRAMRRTAPNEMATIEQVMDYIAHCEYRTLGMPGEYMSYSNEGYAVLCYVFDAASGERLEDYVREHIYEPLGMTRTVMDDDCSGAQAISGGNITSLFEMDENGGVICDDHWSVLPPFRGCAMVKSTAKDMAAYYRCIANFGMHEGRQALPRRAIERLIGAEFPLLERPVYCLGLNKRRFGGATICEHGGGLHGVATYGSLLLGQGWGFAALSNLGDADPCEMGWTMMNAVLGLAPETDHGWSHPVDRPFDAPEMLAGEYVGHEGEPVHLAVKPIEGGIAVERDGEPLRAVYCGGSLFNCHAVDGDGLAARAEFLLRDGQAWGVRWGTRIFERVRK